MICVKDAAMNAVHLSPEWSGFTGIDVAASLGRGWLAAVHPADRDCVDRTLVEAARARLGVSMRYRLIHRSGAAIWVSDDAVASFSPDDGGFLGLLGSITELPAGADAGPATGRVGAFHPPPPLPSTLTAAPGDLLADHLLLARALAERQRDAALMELLDLALHLARKRLDRSTH